MVVGVLKVDVFIGGATSLKEKRRIIRSVCDRVRARYNVAIAEVAGADLWQRCTFGVACVSNEVGFVDAVLSRVVREIESQAALDITNCEKTVV